MPLSPHDCAKLSPRDGSFAARRRLRKRPGRPQRFARRSAAVQCAALWLGAVGGCHTAVPAPEEAVAEVAPSPEKQLDHVMRRMKEALKHARAAADTGIVSERRCAYKLIEPTATDDRYLARVVIDTTVTLKSNGGNAITPIGETEDAGDSPNRRQFKLVYKNQRWELLEPPLEELSDVEKICFQSALSDG